MPQPVLTDVHIQSALTTIATAYVQQRGAYIADRVFAMVPVQHQADKYFKWTKGDWFRDLARPRADATESAGGGFNLTTGSYSATVWALHKDVGDQVRRNADPAVDIDMTTTQWLMQQLLISRDRTFMTTYMKTGLWGTDVTGVASAPSAVQTVYWGDDANGDPFSDIALGQTTILQNTGFKANVLAMGWPVYQALRKHPLVVDRIKYTMTAYAGTITPELMAQAFDVEEIVVSEGVYNSAAEGATDVMGFMMGKHALLCYRNKAPGLMVPSAGYIFPWEGFTGENGLGIRVMQIDLPWLGKGTVRTEAEMSFDMQAIGTDLGYFFSGIVA